MEPFQKQNAWKTDMTPRLCVYLMQFVRSLKDKGGFTGGGAVYPLYGPDTSQRITAGHLSGIASYIAHDGRTGFLD